MSDYDKPSKEIAMQQIYIATGYKAPTAKVTFGAASELDPFPAVPTDENTFVPFDIDPLEDSRFVGDNGFLYQRLDLSIITPAEDIPSVPLEYPFTTHEALPLLNSLLGTQLDENDVENDTHTNPAIPVKLRAKKTSIAWVGEKEVNPVDDDNQFLVRNPVLPGFVEVPANPPAQPYLGTSNARLVALINAHTGQDYVEGVDFTFGKITTVNGPNYNTRIRIKPVNVEVYSEQDLYYNRLSIQALTRRPSATLGTVEIASLPFSIHDELADINAALGLNLTAAEVFNTTYTSEQATYTLQVRSGASVAWAPSSYNFAATVLPPIGREMEDGTARTMEDGSPREMEDDLPG